MSTLRSGRAHTCVHGTSVSRGVAAISERCECWLGGAGRFPSIRKEFHAMGCPWLARAFLFRNGQRAAENLSSLILRPVMLSNVTENATARLPWWRLCTPGNQVIFPKGG